jgi:hypothetical protein
LFVSFESSTITAFVLSSTNIPNFLSNVFLS